MSVAPFAQGEVAATGAIQPFPTLISNRQGPSAPERNDMNNDRDRAVRSLQRRLEHWELVHLRALASELHERLEYAEAALERVSADLQQAHANAWFWQEQVQRLEEALADACVAVPRVGITRQGELLALPAEH